MRIHFDCYDCGLGILADFDPWVTLDHFDSCPNCHSLMTEAEEYEGELPKSAEDLIEVAQSEGWTINSADMIDHGVVKESWRL